MLFSARDRDILKGCRRTHASPCSSSSPLARPSAPSPLLLLLLLLHSHCRQQAAYKWNPCQFVASSLAPSVTQSSDFVFVYARSQLLPFIIFPFSRGSRSRSRRGRRRLLLLLLMSYKPNALAKPTNFYAFCLCALFIRRILLLLLGTMSRTRDRKQLPTKPLPPPSHYSVSPRFGLNENEGSDSSSSSNNNLCLSPEQRPTQSRVQYFGLHDWCVDGAHLKATPTTPHDTLEPTTHRALPKVIACDSTRHPVRVRVRVRASPVVIVVCVQRFFLSTQGPRTANPNARPISPLLELSATPTLSG